MTKAQLYTFTTSLLDDYQMDTTLFNTFLDIAQMYWENQRPWMILRAEDSSNTISTSNVFTTAKTLPTDFRRWYARFPIVLTDSQGETQQSLREVSLQAKFAYRTDNTKFYCNYKLGNFYVCGTPSQSLTANIYYIAKSTLVSLADSNEWIFPTEYHAILGLSIATYWKLGVDYDIINNAQGNNNAGLAAQIFAQMSEWDGGLQAGSIEGQDYGTGGGWTFTSSGGRLSPDIM